MKKRKKRGLKIIVILVIIVLAIAIIVKLNKRKIKIEPTYEIAEIEYNYFLLYLNEKYGVIDTSGNIVIQPEYDNLIIPNPKEDVFICSNDGDSKNKVLDQNGKELYTIYDNVEAISINGVTTTIPYEKDILKYRVNDQYGLINIEGIRITKAIYEEIDGLKYEEGNLIVKQNGKYGVIDLNGKKKLNISYDGIEADKYYDENLGYENTGYIVSYTTEEGYRYGYISSSGKKILEIEYNDLKRVTNIDEKDNIYLIVSKDGQYGFFKNDKQIIDYKYQGIEYNALNNLLIINKANKYGIYTLEGNEVIPIEYKTLLFNGIYVYAKNGSDIKYFTNKGEEVTNGFTSLKPVDDGKYYISMDNYGLHGIVDSDNNILVENKYVYIDYLFDNYFSAYKNESGLGIIKANGDIVTDYKYTILNRIGETNLIKAEDMTNNTIEIYNKDLDIISKLDNAELDIRDTYFKLYNENTIIYINFQGDIITEKEAIESSEEAPDTIGDYEKEYYGYSQVYYTISEE